MDKYNTDLVPYVTVSKVAGPISIATFSQQTTTKIFL